MRLSHEDPIAGARYEMQRSAAMGTHEKTQLYKQALNILQKPR